MGWAQVSTSIYPGQWMEEQEENQEFQTGTDMCGTYLEATWET